MEEYEVMKELIQASLTNPYWQLVNNKDDQKEGRLEDYQRRISILSRMKRDIASLESRILEMKQDSQWKAVREYLSYMGKLVELQLQFNRMLCHRHNGCGLNMGEYEKVSFEIDRLERLIAHRLEGKRTSL